MNQRRTEAGLQWLAGRVQHTALSLNLAGVSGSAVVCSHALLIFRDVPTDVAASVNGAFVKGVSAD